jgi:protein-arginine kinase
MLLRTLLPYEDKKTTAIWNEHTLLEKHLFPPKLAVNPFLERAVISTIVTRGFMLSQFHKK